MKTEELVVTDKGKRWQEKDWVKTNALFVGKDSMQKVIL